MFEIFKMSEEKKLLLADKNWASFRNMNEYQLRKFSGLPITPIRISLTTQKIVLLLDAMYKIASFSNKFKYKDISINKLLYNIIGDYFLKILEDQSYFPDYEKFKEHSDLIIEKLFKKLIDTDDTFRSKIQNG